ncbi:MAG: phospholipid/cholesterol/gamma-HCH transport system substrate-binding protein [Nocardioidaceae bacterium]|nr:phospholipid/cholesterol/gamma-HCH transport system substrate-binding protein [Nocardioidaceae bacterium]
MKRLAPILALAVLLAGCALPGNVTGSRELTATFADVGDLVSGHSVQVADVRVGSIKKIVLTKDYKAEVTLSIKDGIDIPADSDAILRTTSLLGEKFIELRPPEGRDPTKPPFFDDGDKIPESRTKEAPELEFVAEQAVGVLGAVTASDVGSLVQTGAVGFGGRAQELGALLDNLSTISATLADSTDEIVRIINGLDTASKALAGGAQDIDQLLANLSETTTVLAANRDRALNAIKELTRLANVQNTEVFVPYRNQVDQQIKQLDGILAVVAHDRQEVGTLLDWVDQFTQKIPKGIPEDFAQVYGWFVVTPLD